MRHLVRPVLLAVVLLVPASGRAEGPERRELPPFSALEIDAAVGLDLVVDPSVGDRVTLEVTGSARARERLRTTVRGDRLVIDMTGWGGLGSAPRISGRVPALTELVVDGVADGTVSGLRGRRFRLVSSGAGRLALAGRVERLEMDLHGAGKVRAFDLSATGARVEVSGAGAVEVCAEDLLEVEVSGVGSVTYDCDPDRVRRRVAGVGAVRPR